MLICGPSHFPWPRVHGHALSPAGGLIVPRTISWARRRSEEPYFALQNSARQAMHSYCACFLWIPPPPPLKPLLLCNCSGSQDSWHLTTRSAIFNFSAHHSWALSPHTGASTAAVSSPLRVQTENQCCAYREGVQEVGDPGVVPQPPGLPSSAHCLVQRGNTAIHKMWHSCVQHTAVSPFYSVIKTTSVRPYLLMFGPGGELYCPELLSPPLLQEAGL